MRSRRLFRTLLLLSLVILVPLFLVPLAHAVSFVNTQKLLTQSGPGSFALPAISVTAGNGLIVVVDNSRQSGSTGPTISDTLTSSWTTAYNVVSNGNVKETVFWAVMASSASEVVTITVGGGGSGPIEIVEFQYSQFTGVGATVTNVVVPGSGTGTDSLSLTVASNSVVLETGSISNSVVATCGSISLTDTNRYNNCDSSAPVGYGQQINEHGPIQTPSTVSFTMSYSGWNAPSAFVHGLIELQGSPVPTSGTVTSCFGNCGNPAITLVNTNSTHTTNFNQTLTIFYEFQSTLNGFLLNVTTNIARNYGFNGNGANIGVYTIPNCPVGLTPFSTSCPGLLQQSLFTGSPPKGKLSLSNLKIPVANGQWVAIALTATFSGLDVNDTNTNVQMFQTQEGKMPAVIQLPASLGTVKVGLWAFIMGNVITGIPPPSTTNGSCFGLDCILASVVNSSCQVVTAACQTGSSLFWIIILTIVTIAVALTAVSYAFPGINVSTKGAMELGTLIFVAWFAVFASFNLLLSWLIILMFFVVAWLFLGRLKGSGPI